MLPTGSATSQSPPAPSRPSHSSQLGTTGTSSSTTSPPDELHGHRDARRRRRTRPRPGCPGRRGEVDEAAGLDRDRRELADLDGLGVLGASSASTRGRARSSSLLTNEAMKMPEPSSAGDDTALSTSTDASRSVVPAAMVLIWLVAGSKPHEESGAASRSAPDSSARERRRCMARMLSVASRTRRAGRRVRSGPAHWGSPTRAPATSSPASTRPVATTVDHSSRARADPERDRAAAGVAARPRCRPPARAARRGRGRRRRAAAASAVTVISGGVSRPSPAKPP